MEIVETVNLSSFRDAFRRMDRKDQFSYAAQEVLFEFLEMCSEDSGQPVELDVIALCCEYYESDAATIEAEYSDAPQVADFDGDTDAHQEAVQEWLNDRTQLCGVTAAGGFVYAAF